MAAQIDLAPTPIARLIKQTLPPVSNPHSPDNFRVSKELKAALQRAGGLFALYLAHTAAHVSREAGRQQVTPEDVLGALEELDMDVLVQPTNEFVKSYRKAHQHKAADDDLRPTRPVVGGGSKKSSGGGSSKRKSSGSSSSKKGSTAGSSQKKKVKANVDLTAEAEEEHGEEGGEEEEEQDGAGNGEEMEDGGQEAGD